MIERLKYFFFHVHNDWQIGIVRSDLNKFLFSNLPQKIKWIKCEFNVYQADPFGIEKDGKLYLFYEEYLKDKEYALLKCSVYDTHLNKTDDRVILDDGTHKSFPFVFEHENRFYLMPESGALNKLILYESLEYPYLWGKERVLLNFACSDAIIKKIKDKWFLFYTKSNRKDENEILYLRVSSTISGDWENQHERIVNKNLFNSRNAGAIQEIDGHFFRFAQNCSKYYGENVVVQQISNLDFESYTEETICEKQNPASFNGFHTLNATQNFILVDRRKLRYKLKPVSELSHRIFTKLLRK